MLRWPDGLVEAICDGCLKEGPPRIHACLERDLERVRQEDNMRAIEELRSLLADRSRCSRHQTEPAVAVPEVTAGDKRTERPSRRKGGG